MNLSPATNSIFPSFTVIYEMVEHLHHPCAWKSGSPTHQHIYLNKEHPGWLGVTAFLKEEEPEQQEEAAPGQTTESPKPETTDLAPRMGRTQRGKQGQPEVKQSNLHPTVDLKVHSVSKEDGRLFG